MPKKSVAARTGVQRQKPRAQKSFELVRPEVQEPQEPQESEEAQLDVVPAAESVADAAVAPQLQESVPQATPARPTKSNRGASPASVATKTRDEKVEAGPEETAVTPAKVSASARLAARRQASQRTQQRNSTVLISAEHFSYVRRELIYIATLAVIMFAAIIVLYFLLGRGA